MDDHRLAIIPAAELNANRMARRNLKNGEVFFAAIALMAEISLEYVHAKYPRTIVVIFCVVWLVASFIAGGSLSLRRLKENKSWFDWVHCFFTCLTILLCYIELLQFCEVLKFEWFERVPTTVAAVILVLYVSEMLITKNQARQATHEALDRTAADTTPAGPAPSDKGSEVAK